MSTFGTVQLLNVQSRPQLVSLSTKQGTQCDSTLSDVTWTMQDKIEVPGTNFTAIASLYSMIFYNTFANITSSNCTLKILSTWLDNGVAKSDTITVKVPVGHYDIISFLNTLNQEGVCNKATGGFYYGFGNVGGTPQPPAAQTSPYPGAILPFGVSTSDPAKIIFNLPSAGISGAILSALGTYNVAHVYTGFYLIVDTETIPLLKTMGMLVYNQSNVITNTSTIDSLAVIGFPVFTGGATTQYSFTYPWVAPTTILIKTGVATNCLDLGGPNALTVSWESMNTNTRLSSEGLSIGDCVAVVPVTGAYGYKVVYQPTIPFKCVLPNFNINTFQIKIKDAGTGTLVDFQNVPWIITFNIEFSEIENNNMSEMAAAGVGQVVMPTLHGIVRDHNLPFSGTSGYRDSAKRHRIHPDASFQYPSSSHHY